MMTFEHILCCLWTCVLRSEKCGFLDGDGPRSKFCGILMMHFVLSAISHLVAVQKSVQPWFSLALSMAFFVSVSVLMGGE